MSLRKLNDAIVIVIEVVRELQNVATNCIIIGPRLIRWMNGRNERGGRNVNEKGKGQCPRAGCLMLARVEFRFRTHPCVSTCSEPRFCWLFPKSTYTTYPRAANFSSNPKWIARKIRIHKLNLAIIYSLRYRYGIAS